MVMSHGFHSISASKNDNCREWKVFLCEATALGKHACVTAIMVACSLPRRRARHRHVTPSLRWQPSTLCISDVCTAVHSALTHLE